ARRAAGQLTGIDDAAGGGQVAGVRKGALRAGAGVGGRADVEEDAAAPAPAADVRGEARGACPAASDHEPVIGRQAGELAELEPGWDREVDVALTARANRAQLGGRRRAVAGVDNGRVAAQREVGRAADVKRR